MDVNHVQVLKFEKRWSAYRSPQRPIPKLFAAKLHQVGFFDTDDTDLRLEMAMQILETYRLSTAIRYFNVLKYGEYFGDTEKTKNFVLRKESFSKKLPQQRLPEREKFLAFIKLLTTEFKKHFREPASLNTLRQNNYIRAIFAMYLCWNTALRVSSILSFTNKVLYQLNERSAEIRIQMKNKQPWSPLYNPQLNNLIDLLSLYYSNFLAIDLEVPLFPFGKTYLKSILVMLYVKANNQPPPTGFGLHSIRYYIGTEFAKTNLQTAQLLLGHKSIKTTRVYVKHQYNLFKSRLEEIEKESKLFQDVHRLFQPQ
jgi:integrase